MGSEAGGPNPLNKPGAAVAAAKDAPLEDPARVLLRAEHSPKQYLDELAKAGHLADAVRLLAFALPRREAVWWAAQCVKAVPPLTADPKAAAAVGLAEAWAQSPTDDARRAAYAAAEVAGLTTPAGCAALAAFLSDGSLAPPNLQAVPPPPHAGPSATAGAAILAAVSTEPEKADEKFKRFLALGDEVAAGTNRWAEARPKPPAEAGGPPLPPVSRPGQPPPPTPPTRSWY